jgi:hypothetical protein
MCRDNINSWDDFVREVEAEFGISQSLQERQFRSLHPWPEENGYKFVKRIE